MPRLSRIEKLLNKVRREPSPTCRCQQQLELEDAVKLRAFAALDQSIKEVLDQTK